MSYELWGVGLKIEGFEIVWSLELGILIVKGVPDG
jgi:hypothetical protein